ncbi:peptidase M10A and M12B matrixin and adamalysin [Pseudarthrobacter phenanthrenivorans]|uniref:peptidase M10A and M12B matrixin and adamalysin n=1 Tax=Pseudarthrobacter phenanthrenivorans TaxID=361575 RepID=UPI00344DBD80
MSESPYTFLGRQIVRATSVFALAAGMVFPVFPAGPAVIESPYQVGQSALAVVTPRTAPSQPTLGLVEAAHPLGAPAPPTEPSSAFKFLETNPDGSPVAYDPCRPIHYVTNGAKQPANGPQLVKEALAAVSKATGLVFIDDGSTNEPGGFQRKAFQPERYGDRWAPVLIAWIDQSDQPKYAGYTHSQWFSVDGGNAIYETGEVDLSVNPAYNGDDKYELAVLKHEFGHLMGLAHDDDGDQLMTSKAIHQKYDYQPGDLAGLAILGQGKCLGF